MILPRRTTISVISAFALIPILLTGCGGAESATGTSTIPNTNTNTASTTPPGNDERATTVNLPELAGDWKKVDMRNTNWTMNGKPMSVAVYTAPASANLEELCVSVIMNVDEWAKENKYTPSAEKKLFLEGIDAIVRDSSKALSECSQEGNSSSLGETFDDLDDITDMGGGAAFIIETGKEGEISTSCNFNISEVGTAGSCRGSEKIGGEGDYTIVFAH